MKYFKIFLSLFVLFTLSGCIITLTGAPVLEEFYFVEKGGEDKPKYPLTFPHVTELDSEKSYSMVIGFTDKEIDVNRFIVAINNSAVTHNFLISQHYESQHSYWEDFMLPPGEYTLSGYLMDKEDNYSFSKELKIKIN